VLPVFQTAFREDESIDERVLAREFDCCSIALYVKMLGEFGERLYFKPEATPIGPRLSALARRDARPRPRFRGHGWHRAGR
jgi:hypothetical protein